MVASVSWFDYRFSVSGYSMKPPKTTGRAMIDVGEHSDIFPEEKTDQAACQAVNHPIDRVVVDLTL